MNVKDYIDIILGVLKSPYVIGTVIVMILVIEFSKYVASYKKKPPKPKVKKGAKKPVAVVAKPKEEGGEADGENATSAS